MAYGRLTVSIQTYEFRRFREFFGDAAVPDTGYHSSLPMERAGCVRSRERVYRERRLSVDGVGCGKTRSAANRPAITDNDFMY